jgi:MFS family permease
MRNRYKKEEQASTIIYWYMMNGLQQILGGLAAFAFSFVPHDSPIKSWQALFMTYGIATVFWGFFVLFWMPDSPMKAKCWSEEDKKLMIERVRENRTGVQNRVFRKEQIYHAIADPQGNRRYFEYRQNRRKFTDYRSLRLCFNSSMHNTTFGWNWCICQYPG